jgi:hypothetical protein
MERSIRISCANNEKNRDMMRNDETKRGRRL